MIAIGYQFGGDVRPAAPEAFITLKQGRAIARLGTGAFAIPLETDGPLDKPPAWRGEKVREVSWERFEIPALNQAMKIISNEAAWARSRPPTASA